MSTQGDPVHFTTRSEVDRLDVVGIGNPLVDVLVTVEESIIDPLGLTHGSMTLVDLEHSNRIYDAVGPAIEVSGGSAANTLAGIAALGGRAGFTGKIARDTLGEVFTHDLTSTGVVFEPVYDTRTSGDSGTGRCLVLITDDAKRTMATHLGAAEALEPNEINETFVERCDLLYLEGYLWDLAPAKEAMRRAIAAAHRANGSVAITLSDSFCVERHRRSYLDLLNGDIDVLLANEDEIRALFEAPSLDYALDALEETGVLGAITRGAQGSVVVTPGGRIEIAPSPATQVIDTTGAGDLYASGFLFGLTHGLDPATSAELGGICASEIISHVGARPQVDLVALAIEAEIFEAE